MTQAPTRIATALLTERERQVVALLMSGIVSNADIADVLICSEHTVHFHVANVLKKLHVINRTALVSHAYRHGIVVAGEWYPNADD